MITTIDYFKQIATSHPTLEKSKQIEFFLKSKDETRQPQERLHYKNRLLKSTYGLCLKFVSTKRTDHMLDIEELLHICIEAQHKAYNKYDPESECSFSTYLVTWMRSYIISSLKQLRVVKLPNEVALRDAPVRLSMSGNSEDQAFDFSNEDEPAFYQMSQASALKVYKLPRSCSPKNLTQGSLF